MPFDCKKTHVIEKLKEEEKKIFFVKRNFSALLSSALNLTEVSAPLYLPKETGLNDNLNGIEMPVEFTLTDSKTKQEMQIVQSLAKWKRFALKEYGFEQGEGLLTDMRAIRKDEIQDETHSIFVDQWDWEISIAREQRNLDFLKKTVEKIYASIQKLEQLYFEVYKINTPILPEKISFIHSEDLQSFYPHLSPKERETAYAREHGALFLIGIGGLLVDGSPHDKRAPDYDDWTTKTSEKYTGLNGDIIVYHPELESSFELSSMGIRVDAESLKKQSELLQTAERLSLPYHKSILREQLPFSIGGGIGQSRLTMFMMRKNHIKDVQLFLT